MNRTKRILCGCILFFIMYISLILAQIYLIIAGRRSIADVISLPLRSMWIATILLGFLVFLLLQHWLCRLSRKDFILGAVTIWALAILYLCSELNHGVFPISLSDYYWNHYDRMEAILQKMNLLVADMPSDFTVNNIFLYLDISDTNLLNALIAYATYYVCMIIKYKKQSR